MTKLIIPVFLTMLVMPAFSQTTAEEVISEVNLERLALQGNAEAQFQLGIIYELGRGVPEDSAEASRWFRMAAFLGIEVRRGRGVPQDYAEAVRWFRASAEQGHKSAQRALGFRYSEGQGISQDYVQAHKWLNLSTVNEADRERAVTLRDDLAKKMTPEQVAEAQQLVSEWKPKPWEVIRQELKIE